MEFVDGIADPKSDEVSSKFSNIIFEQIQYEKRLSPSPEKCELLKVNSMCRHGSITVNSENIKSFGVARYLVGQFNSKGKKRFGRAKGSAFELIALCREVKFGTRQIENMFILYQPVFFAMNNLQLRIMVKCDSCFICGM